MTESKNANELFDTLARILLRCFVLGYAVVLLWFVLYLIAGGMIYGVARWFHLEPHDVDLMNYCGIALVKTLVILFFLIPYIAIRLVRR